MPWLVAGCLHTLTTAKRPSTLLRYAFPELPCRPAAFYCVGLPQDSPPAPANTQPAGGFPTPLEKQPEGEARRVPDSSQMGQSSKVGQLGEAALPLRPHCPLFFPQAPARGGRAGLSITPAGYHGISLPTPASGCPTARPLHACCLLSIARHSRAPALTGGCLPPLLPFF